MMTSWRLAIILCVLCAGPTHAANTPIYQSGLVTPGHTLMSITSGVAGDAGPALSGKLTEIGITNTGTPFCINDAPISGPYHQFCLGANVNGAAGLFYNAYGGAGQLPFDCAINGSSGSCFNQVVGLPQVASNANLMATASTAYPVVVRAGFTASGDSQAVLYTSSGSPCILNSGNGDNGSQVKSADNKCWLIVPLQGGYDARIWGATCGTGDSTSALQSAVSFLAASNGGTLVIPCVMTVAGGNISLGNQTTIRGLGFGYGQQTAVPNPNGVWPPTSGSAINCTSVTNPCFLANGIGDTFQDLMFGNPQPTIPTSGSWTPTVFPYVIATTGTSGWQNLAIRYSSCTTCSNFIDLEGTPNYTAYSGSHIYIDRVWCNACLNNGLMIHRIDNPLIVDGFDFVEVFSSNPPLGAYQRANLTQIAIKYVAAPQFNNINCYAGLTCFYLQNDTVTNSFGTITMAMSAGQFGNVMSNQACQAITTTGNSTIAEFKAISNFYVWGDQSGFACSTGKAMLELPSNTIRMNIDHGGITAVDTFADIGCGTPGVGACPGGAFGGSAIFHMIDVYAPTAGGFHGYGNYTPSAPFIKAPSSTVLDIGSSNANLINGQGGGLVTAGADGTTATFGTDLKGEVTPAGLTIFNAGTLPTSCTGQAVGTFYVPSPHVVGVC